jgi:hypothetical protein
MEGRRLSERFTRRPAGRRFVTVLGALVLLFGPSAALVANAPAASADDLELTNDITYRVLPEEHAVQVEQTVIVANNKAPTQSGNTITNYFVNSVRVLVPVKAVDLRASVDGSPVEFHYEDAKGNFQIAVASTGSNVQNGQRRTVSVVYRIPDGGPRSTASARVNEAYAAFPIVAVGDLSRTTLRVVFPARFGVARAFMSKAEFGSKDGERVLELRDFPKGQVFFDLIDARDDNALDKRDIFIEGHAISLKYWPGDTTWADFTQRELERAIPVLEQRTGEAWPEKDGFQFIEAFTPYLLGYAGWYLPLEDKIEVGDELNALVIYHELSHTWFNRDNFQERWINEGLAEELASLASSELGGEKHDPTDINVTDPGMVLLSKWGQISSVDEEAARDREAFGYNASFAVVRAIGNDVGIEKLQQLLRVAIGHQISYAGDTPRERSAVATNDWKRLLDLAENVGNSTRTEDELRRHVLDDDQVALLPERTEARAAYTELRTTSGDWAPTVYLRHQMDSWNFALARTSIADAKAAMARRDDLSERAAALALTMPTTYESIYEAEAADLTATKAKADEIDNALGAIATSTDIVLAPRPFITKVGLWGKKPEIELDVARAAFNSDKLTDVDALSRVASTTVATARSVGTKRVIGASAAAVGLVGVITAIVVRLRRRRRRSRESVEEPVAEQPTIDEPAIAEPVIEEPATLPPPTPEVVAPIIPAEVAPQPVAPIIPAEVLPQPVAPIIPAEVLPGPVEPEPLVPEPLVPEPVAVVPEPVAAVPALVAAEPVRGETIRREPVRIEPVRVSQSVASQTPALVEPLTPASTSVFGRPVELRVRVEPTADTPD